MSVAARKQTDKLINVLILDWIGLSLSFLSVSLLISLLCAFVVSETIDLMFTAEPRDTVVSRNASVVIDCAVPAGWLQLDTSPVIEWKRDGVLLNLMSESRRYIVPFYFLCYYGY